MAPTRSPRVRAARGSSTPSRGPQVRVAPSTPSPSTTSGSSPSVPPSCYVPASPACPSPPDSPHSSRVSPSSSPSSSLSPFSSPSPLPFQIPRKKPSRCKDRDHVPRPPNCFILFRKEARREIKRRAIEERETGLSKIAGHMWQKLDPDVRKRFEVLAEKAKLEHAKLYPGYRFSPKPRDEPAKKRNIKRNTPARDALFLQVADGILKGKSDEELRAAVAEVDAEQEREERVLATRTRRARPAPSPAFMYAPARDASSSPASSSSASSPSTSSSPVFLHQQSPLLPPACPDALPELQALPGSFTALNFGAFAPAQALADPPADLAIDAETGWMRALSMPLLPLLPTPPTEFAAAPIPAFAPIPVPVPGGCLGFYPGGPTDERPPHALVPAPNVFGDHPARADAAYNMPLDDLELLYALEGLLPAPTQPMQNWSGPYPVHGPFPQPPPSPPQTMGNMHTPAQGAWAQGYWTQ